MSEWVSQPFPPSALRRRNAKTVRVSTSSYKIDYVTMTKNFLNPEGHQNPFSSSKVTAILLKGWIWPIGWASAGECLPCSLRSRLVSFKKCKSVGLRLVWIMNPRDMRKKIVLRENRENLLYWCHQHILIKLPLSMNNIVSVL